MSTLKVIGHAVKCIKDTNRANNLSDFRETQIYKAQQVFICKCIYWRVCPDSKHEPDKYDTCCKKVFNQFFRIIGE